MRVKTDPHSPGKYRVNGVVSNMPEFFEAFDREGRLNGKAINKIILVILKRLEELEHEQ